MTSTNIAQLRAEMKARIAAHMKAGQELSNGKRITNGRYTFKVNVIEMLGNRQRIEIAAYIGDDHFRTVLLDAENRRFVPLYGYNLTAPLLKALCESFVTAGLAGANDRTHLLLVRAIWFGNSATYGKRVRGAYGNPFGA